MRNGARRYDGAARARYAGLALATVAAGLAVHRSAAALPAPMRDVAGDALWAAMVYWIAGVLAPHARPARRAGAALAVAWAVEFGQLVRAPWLVALRATPLGHLALGADFDARDLAAYAAGVAAAALAERPLGARVLGTRALTSRRSPARARPGTSRPAPPRP